MSTTVLIIIAIIFGLSALTLSILLKAIKNLSPRAILILRVSSIVTYLATSVFLLMWASRVYEEQGSAFACWTYLCLFLVFGSVLALIQIPKQSKLYYIPLVTVLLFGILFIVLEINLSIKIFQPNIPDGSSSSLAKIILR